MDGLVAAGPADLRTTGLAFSPDGRRLAAFKLASSTRNPRVRVWDATTGKEVLALAQPDAALQPGVQLTGRHLAFTSDGHRLVGCEVTRIPGNLRQFGLLVLAWDATPRAEAKP
jgi:hypothetical protein